MQWNLLMQQLRYQTLGGVIGLSVDGEVGLWSVLDF